MIKISKKENKEETKQLSIKVNAGIIARINKCQKLLTDNGYKQIDKSELFHDKIEEAVRSLESEIQALIEKGDIKGSLDIITNDNSTDDNAIHE